MANNVSGFGLQVALVANKTFPAGFVITQFADDSDPFDVPELTVADTAMGVNGDLISWAKANPIKIKIGVIPDSVDDINLGILLENNRPGMNTIVAGDVIQMTAVYPSGMTKILTNGVITSGQPASGVSSSGRLKSKEYSFSFENRVGL